MNWFIKRGSIPDLYDIRSPAKKGIKKGIKHTLLQVQTNLLNTLQCSTHAHKL